MNKRAEEFVNSKTSELNGLAPDKLTVIKWLTDFASDEVEAINYTRCCTELNNCFKVGENVIYLGVKMKITFVDNLQKTVNMYCMCDETNWEAISLSKLTKII